MRYINAKTLDQMEDNHLVFVNRNVFNATIAEYEIQIE